MLSIYYVLYIFKFTNREISRTRGISVAFFCVDTRIYITIISWVGIDCSKSSILMTGPINRMSIHHTENEIVPNRDAGITHALFPSSSAALYIIYLHCCSNRKSIRDWNLKTYQHQDFQIPLKVHYSLIGRVKFKIDFCILFCCWAPR